MWIWFSASLRSAGVTALVIFDPVVLFFVGVDVLRWKYIRKTPKCRSPNSLCVRLHDITVERRNGRQRVIVNDDEEEEEEGEEEEQDAENTCNFSFGELTKENRIPFMYTDTFYDRSPLE